jgi:hypothetical protein
MVAYSMNHRANIDPETQEERGMDAKRQQLAEHMEKFPVNVQHGSRWLLTVTTIARRIVVEETKERLRKLLELNAPDVILWNEAYRLDPLYLPVGTKPQRRLLEEYGREPVLERVKDGRGVRMRTPKGVIVFFPKGRWGPYFKEVVRHGKQEEVETEGAS